MTDPGRLKIYISGQWYYAGYGPTGPTGQSGQSGQSGWSGTSGQSGQSGISGWSGTSGQSGQSGISGWSGWSGISGWSGWSGQRTYAPAPYLPATAFSRGATNASAAVQSLAIVPDAGYSAFIPLYVWGQYSLGSGAYASIDVILENATKLNLFYVTAAGAYTSGNFSLNTENIVGSMGTQAGHYVATVIHYLGRPTQGTSKMWSGVYYAYEF